ncbi:DUF4118 domain-containing protein, partial [Thioclava sp. BHET1]
NVRRIVIGRPRPVGWLARLTHENVARAMLKHGADFEITVTSEPKDKPGVAPPLRARLRQAGTPSLRAYAAALLVTAAATVLAMAAPTFFPRASLSLIFMTGVIVVASAHRRGAAIAASALSFLSYNFFFTEPRLSFSVVQEGDIVPLGLFLVASIITGNLAARLRARIEA